jgi:hypothetical protein
MTGQDLDDFVARFIACEVPHAEWTHQAHLTVGLCHIDRHGADSALPLLRQRIRRLNDSNGVANTPDSGYHETITAAYVQILDGFLRTCASGLPLADRVKRLLECAIAEREYLLRFYSRDVLMSSRARQNWVEPDLAPLRPAQTSP